MPNLLDLLDTVTQRTSGYGTSFTKTSEQALFNKAVKEDISNLVTQLNGVYMPAFAGLGSGGTRDALSLAISGNSIITSRLSNASSDPIFYDTATSSQLTVKESFDATIARFNVLETSVSALSTSYEYDDTEVVADIASLEDAMSVVEGDVTLLQSWVGFTTLPPMPRYSSYGVTTIVTDSTPLPEAIADLDVHVGNLTLQSLYDQGVSLPPSGTIDIGDGSLGAFQIIADVGTSSIAKFGYDVGDPLLEVKEDFVQVSNAGLLLTEYVDNGPGPDAVSGAGSLYTAKNIGAAGQVELELFFTDEDANEVQLTSRGKVKDNSFVSEWVKPTDMTSLVAPSDVTLGSAPNSDIIYKVFSFGGGSDIAYCNVAIPVDASDKTPLTATYEVYTIPLDNTAEASVKYKVKVSTNYNAEPNKNAVIIGSGSSVVPPQWTELGNVFATHTTTLFNSTTDQNKVKTLTGLIVLGDPTTISTAGKGLLCLKIERDTADVDDTYSGNVGILGVQVSYGRGY